MEKKIHHWLLLLIIFYHIHQLCKCLAEDLSSEDLASEFPSFLMSVSCSCKPIVTHCIFPLFNAYIQNSLKLFIQKIFKTGQQILLPYFQKGNYESIQTVLLHLCNFSNKNCRTMDTFSKIPLQNVLSIPQVYQLAVQRGPNFFL